MPIYAVKATAGQERVVAELMYREAENRKEKDRAEELCILLQNQRLEPYLAETLIDIEKIH